VAVGSPWWLCLHLPLTNALNAPVDCNRTMRLADWLHGVLSNFGDLISLPCSSCVSTTTQIGCRLHSKRRQSMRYDLIILMARPPSEAIGWRCHIGAASLLVRECRRSGTTDHHPSARPIRSDTTSPPSLSS
jgi:hypothetical protein